jgi:hypothetical protein
MIEAPSLRRKPLKLFLRCALQLVHRGGHTQLDSMALMMNVGRAGRFAFNRTALRCSVYKQFEKNVPPSRLWQDTLPWTRITLPPPPDTPPGPTLHWIPPGIQIPQEGC